MKAWWAESEDHDRGRGLGLSRTDMGQQGAEERRRGRPCRALLASAQCAAVGGRGELLTGMKQEDNGVRAVSSGPAGSCRRGTYRTVAGGGE